MVAAIVGFAVGRWIYVVADQPNMAAMLALFAIVGFLVILAIIGVIGLVAILTGDRGGGARLLLVAMCLAGGAYLAVLFGDGVQ